MLPDGPYPVFGANGVIGRYDKFNHETPQLLITCRGATCGSVNVSEPMSWITGNAMVVRPKSENLDLRFLEYMFRGGMDITPAITGAAQPQITRTNLNPILIRYPLDLEEQQRIVTLLDEAFDGIATAKANDEKNLQNALELVGTGFQALTESLGRTGWPIQHVESLAASHKGAMRTGPFGSQLLHSEFVDEGIAVLGIDNAVANEFRWDRRRYITPEKYQQMGRYRVFPRDILITIMGTCGRCAVVPDDIPVAINTKHLCCITLNREKCLSEYLHIYFLHDLTARDYLTAHAKGSIMAGLNMGIIAELPVRLPSLAVQAEIVERFASLKEETQRLESLYQRKLQALDDLKKSLLHQAFSGGV